MKPVSNVLWPVGLTKYVSLGSSEAMESPKTHSEEYITTKREELKSCSPVASVLNYWTLVELISQLSTLNSNYELYFRGQRHPYINPSNGCHLLLPSIWRAQGDTDFISCSNELKDVEQRLKKEFSSYARKSKRMERELDESPIARWALIQHYGIARTPLLDLTRSLHVACSFALERSSVGFLYVLGLPYQRERFMTDSYSGIVNVSLLGVTPHDAKRPLAQAGFLASGSDWWRIYADDSEGYSKKRAVDFSSRIIAVLKLEDKGDFWTRSSMAKLEVEQLYPQDDAFLSFLLDSGFEPYCPDVFSENVSTQ